MRLVFAGTPAFAAVALRAVLDAGHVVPLVLTQPDRPAGRGMSLQPSEVKQVAQARALAVYQPISLKGDEAIARLRAERADAMLVAAYGLILPQAVLDLFPYGCINVHASLLPRWRGAAPIQRAIEAGDARTGISIMHMEAGLDTGPVYLERSLEIRPDETAASLHDRLAELAGQAVCEALSALAEGGLTPVPQPQAGVTYASKITRSEAPLNWTRTARELERQVRAFNPFPVATVTIGEETIRVWQSSVVDIASAPPGRVVHVDEDGIVVACGSGEGLRLEAMQRPGGKRLSAAEFLRGMPVRSGQQLGPVE